MRDITKYQGIIPAFYACYGEDGSISTERTKVLADHLLKKGVKGVYVGGSSGECIYQSKGGTQGSSGSRDGGCKGKDDRYCPCSLQQYGGQLRAGSSCREPGCGCGSVYSTHLFPFTGACHCSVLE